MVMESEDPIRQAMLQALKLAGIIKCPKCAGRIMLNYEEDYACINCGFILFISDQPSLLHSNFDTAARNISGSPSERAPKYIFDNPFI